MLSKYLVVCISGFSGTGSGVADPGREGGDISNSRGRTSGIWAGLEFSENLVRI